MLGAGSHLYPNYTSNRNAPVPCRVRCLKTADALVMFCGRYLEILLFEGSIQMCRVSMAETERFPEQAAQYFDVLFTY